MERQLDVSKVTENCGVGATPVLYKGAFYVAEYSTYIRAISPDTGNEIWSFKANGPIMSSPAIVDDVIYFGCHDNYVYALSIEGNLLWKFRTGGFVASAPAVSEGKVYIGSSDNCVYAIDSKTGRKVWAFRTGDEVASGILAHAGRVFFGSMDSYFYCLDFNGTLLWKFKTGDSIILGNPVVDNKRVYFGSTDERIYALSFDGELVWGFKTGDAVANRLALKAGVLYCGSRDGYLYALKVDSGICIWRFSDSSGSPAMATPLITDAAVYFGKSDRLYALDKQGFLQWSFHANDVIATPPVISDNLILFCSLDGHIRALSQKGVVVWDVLTKSSVIQDFAGIMPPPKNNPKFFDDRAKQLGVGVQEFAKKISDFNPYTFKADSDIKTYLSSDVDRYVDIGESVGAYKDAGKGSVGMYSPAERKKKSETDKMLKDQFGIEY